MTEANSHDDYGMLTAPDTLRIQRLLPGPIERVWAYLIDSDLRRRWLAAGDMEPKVGAPVELVWRNDELTDPPGQRPTDATGGGENRMQSQVLELEPLRRLAIAWGAAASVCFELEQQANQVLLTVVHRKIPDRSSLLNVGPGWHAHLGVLAAVLADERPRPFWDEIARLKIEYADRMPA